LCCSVDEDEEEVEVVEGAEVVDEVGIDEDLIDVVEEDDEVIPDDIVLDDEDEDEEEED